MTRKTTVLLSVVLAACATAGIVGAKKDGLIEYIGAQKNIFATGKTDKVISLSALADRRSLYAIGPVDGLDGEITIFDSKPYVTKVRGSDYILDRSFDHGAIFLAWTQQSGWQDVSVPDSVKSYPQLQRFVKEQAAAAGLDVARPFPFLLAGTPAEVKWHINVDLTEGKPVTRELFAKSKANYVLRNEAVDIIGFHSEKHPGEFISQYAPAIKEGSGHQNAIHIHLVSRTSKAAGHIDDITLGSGMTLRLPRN